MNNLRDIDLDAFSAVMGGERRGSGDQRLIDARVAYLGSVALPEGRFHPVLLSEHYEADRGGPYTQWASVGVLCAEHGGVFACVRQSEWSDQGERRRAAKLLLSGTLAQCLRAAEDWRTQIAEDQRYFTRRERQTLSAQAFERAAHGSS